MQIRQDNECLWGFFMGAHKEIFVSNVDANYPDADPDSALFEYRLNWYWCWFIYPNYVLMFYFGREVEKLRFVACLYFIIL